MSIESTPEPAKTPPLTAWRVDLVVRADGVMAASGPEAISKLSAAIIDAVDFYDGAIIEVRARPSR